MTDQTTTDISSLHYRGASAVAGAEGVLVPPARFGGLSELSPVREIIDVAMVGLVGGGPRLAVRAAKVLLADSYASRTSVRQGRFSRRTRLRGG
jgi:hypothetical protein